MKDLKEKKYYLIVLLTTYVFLKEHYNNFLAGIEKQSLQDIDRILSLLQPLEKFITIPDKVDIINDAFAELENTYCCDSRGKESTFFNNIKEYSKILNVEEKEEILNILFYVINIDNKITSNEKEALLSIANSLGIDHDYNDLFSRYKQSSLKKPFSILKMLLISSIVILPLISAIYYFSLSNSQGSINVFNDKKVMFSKLTFNRFVIYQNKYDVESTHFAKQVVFNIYGTAEIGFDPKNITYDLVTKTIMYSLPKNAPYRVETSSKIKEIDQANPVALSDNEAKKLATGVAIVGGLAGAKVGNSLGSLYPGPQGKIIGSLIGGVSGGVASGLVAFQGLNGLKVSESISRKERKLITEGSKERIKILLELSPELTETYQKSFERYIRALYASRGLEVKQIKYNNNYIRKSGV